MRINKFMSRPVNKFHHYGSWKVFFTEHSSWDLIFADFFNLATPMINVHIRGLPIFVDFVDSTKPRIIIHDEYLSLYLYVLIITRNPRIIIHDEYLSLY
jgi:hypothetical protein